MKYAAKSGGIFLDAGIHDIDAARWLLQIGEKDKVKKVFAIGTIVKFKDLAQFQDADNALAVVEFHNGKFFTFHTGRTTTHGHECMCEIFGENGRFTINQVSVHSKIILFPLNEIMLIDCGPEPTLEPFGYI